MRIAHRRWLTWIVVVVVIAAGATMVLRPEQLDVDVAVAQRSPIRSTVDAEARTRSRSRFEVVAPVAGSVQRMRARPGDVVSQGDVIATVAPLPLDDAARLAVSAQLESALAAQREAQSRIHLARDASALAQRNADRLRAVEAAGGASAQQREQAELEAASRRELLLAAEAHARAAAAEVLAARRALPGPGGANAVLVRSPITGRVLELPEESERIVTAGTPLIVLGRDADLEVVAEVLSEDAVSVKPGAPVELVGWGGDAPLTGTVARVEPAARTRVSALGVDEQRVDVIIVPARAPGSLGDSYRLEARITTWAADRALNVPSSAVFDADGQDRVFVVQNGRARARTVRVGHRCGAHVEILDGLREQELVVLFPSDRVRDGTRVRAGKPYVAQASAD
ncbi:MAG TPA: efflux RND transporter periplasmic adaptor subunit [Gemmatimonadaceae bacterium]|nr:efflux RND transporter periplasmic adaptor subunit [Gemmatimonadaceae bacterium]